MATNPHPRVLREVMHDEFGTNVLITDPASDAYLRASEQKKAKLKEKYGQWCGGPGGWDDFTERFETV